jgi:hypothetical protein
MSPIALVCGFLSDNFILLRRVDLWTSNALLSFYLIVASVGILVLNMIETGRLRRPAFVKSAPFIPIAMQFAFGGLFSGFLSLYSRSAAFPATWVFIVALAALLLSNERFTRLYMRFSLQITLLFFALFSFLTFFLPIITHQIGPLMFLASGAVSLVVIAIFLGVLRFFIPEIVKRDRKRIAASVAAVYIVFNILYFTSIIPPLPLALKDAGVYHAIEKQDDGSYLLTGETDYSWFDYIFPYNQTLHYVPGETIYAWSAVFAPSGLATSILHQWQHYNETTKQWVTVSTFGFSINGGRDGGYRGYSNKSDVTPGRWRVNVTTQYGQIIGRISFTVVIASTSPSLVEETK